MKEVDYIIVGFGLAGMAFAAICEEKGKSILVIDQQYESASLVAAGLYNPVILKRYTLPYKAISQFDTSLSFYKKLEKKLHKKFLSKVPVHKIFHSIEDQNNWFSASDRPGLKRFLKPAVEVSANTAFDAPFNLGEVRETGRLSIKELQASYRDYLISNNAFAKASFMHSELQISHKQVQYQNYKAKHIIFAEGFGLKNNPFFNRLPLVGNKGEYIVIKSSSLAITAALKSSIFIVPLGDDLYKVGATYDWSSKDWEPTDKARVELVSKLKTLLRVPFEIVDQVAGVRPTTGDRRALIGLHPTYKALAVLNGLGTRGVMAAPSMAQQLYDHIELNEPIPQEIDCMRFPNKFS